MLVQLTVPLLLKCLNARKFSVVQLSRVEESGATATQGRLLPSAPVLCLDSLLIGAIKYTFKLAIASEPDIRPKSEICLSKYHARP